MNNYVTTKYLQINDYLLLEYTYSGFEEKNNIPTIGNNGIKCYRIYNNKTKEYYFTNFSYIPNTNEKNINPLSWSIFPIDENKSIYASYEYLNSQNNNFITIEDISSGNNSILFEGENKIPYDSIKIHIISGFTFDSLDSFDGLYFNFYVEDKTNKRCNLSSLLYLKNSENLLLKYNLTPLIFGERVYDKYIEFKIPSFHFIQTINNTFKKLYSNELYLNTHTEFGFKENFPIKLDVYEVLLNKIENNIKYFIFKNLYTSFIESYDTHVFLSCVIRESKIGDFFEYFPTYKGEFIEKYINNLNQNPNIRWIVINNIKVYEQIEENFILTSDITITQLENYDQPSYFRPIILNSDRAVSFLLYYTMKLTNLSTGEQIIRTSSFSSFNVKKYGLNLEKINVKNFYPLKVYNKIYKNITLLDNNLEENSTNNKEKEIIIKYVPRLMSNNNILLNVSKNNYYDNLNNQLYFGNGEYILYLSPFDNIIKFNVFLYENNSYNKVNLLGFKFKLVFVNNDNEKIYINYDEEQSDLINGEIIFNILLEEIDKIKNKKCNEFFIISNDNENDLETVLYIGKLTYEYKNNLSESLLNEINKKLNELNNKEKKLNEEIEKYNLLNEEYNLLIQRLNEYINNQLNNNQLTNNQLTNNQLTNNQLTNNQLDNNQLNDNQLNNIKNNNILVSKEINLNTINSIKQINLIKPNIKKITNKQKKII